MACNRKLSKFSQYMSILLTRKNPFIVVSLILQFDAEDFNQEEEKKKVDHASVLCRAFLEG